MKEERKIDRRRCMKKFRIAKNDKIVVFSLSFLHTVLFISGTITRSASFIINYNIVIY